MSQTELIEWAEGDRRLEASPPFARPARERVVRALVDELRRRLGIVFTVSELAELYATDTDWCLQVALAIAPEDPSAWDAQVVVDAAFYRYAREANDFAGGRLIQQRAGSGSSHSKST